MVNNLDKPLVVESVTEFLNYIIKGTEQEQEFSNFYYRGEAENFPYRTPNLYLNEKLVTEGSEYYYRSLINEMGKDDYRNSSDLVHLLSELQHYGAKTRMLDVTTNPLVALYFATQSTKEPSNGNVYLFKEYKGWEKFDTSLTIAIKSALNFIPQNQINNFLETMWSILVELNYEYYREGQSGYVLLLSMEDLMSKIKERCNILEYKGEDNLTFLGLPISEFLSHEYVPWIEEDLKPGNKSVEDLQIPILTTLQRNVNDFLELLTQITKVRVPFKYPMKIAFDIRNAHIVLTSKNTDRLRQQQGAFIYPEFVNTSNNDIEEIKKAIHDSIMEKAATLNIEGKEYAHIVIPKDKKSIIQKELALIGIDEGFIYPDIQHRSSALLK